jgi:asparagine synthase (glutamine-hydrolysing)
MSGILGFAGAWPRPAAAHRLRAAARLLQHRGLDDQEILFVDRSGHRRLSINPAFGESRSLPASPPFLDCDIAMLVDHHSRPANYPAPGGRGKDCLDDDARISIACDGVVDNLPELLRDLEAAGREMQSPSQFEVLRVAFDEWGPDCFSRIKGTLACAILDFRRRRLFLARDAFGTRPLYYARENGWGVFFASQISALLEATSAVRKINRASLYRYLAYNMMEHGAETFFAGVEQVLSGHYLEVSLEKPSQSKLIRYRQVASGTTKLTFDQAVDHLRQLVIRGVAAQVGVHTDVGAALSGGFDSSFVAAAFAHARRSAPLSLYTCVPAVKDGTFSRSEEAWADLVAAGLRIPVNKVRVPSDDLPASFASLVRLQEEPFSSPVVLAQLQVFRAAQENGVKVMLSGQGGDTMFAASTNQLVSAVLRQVRRGQWTDAGTTLRAGGQLLEGHWPGLALAAARTVIPKGWQQLVRRLRRRPHRDWLRESWFGLDSVARPGNLGLPMLRFEDRNSAACSVLNRMPLLTREIQDFVSSLPPEYLITPNRPIKSVESAAMQGMVPDAILERRERSGFPVPVREWLIELAPWVDMNIAELERLPFFEPRRPRQIWERVQSTDKSISSAFLMWRWIFLAGWLRVFDVSY